MNNILDILNIGYGKNILDFFTYEEALILLQVKNIFFYKIIKEYKWHFKTTKIGLHKILTKFPHTELLDISYKKLSNRKKDICKDIIKINKISFPLKYLSISDCRPLKNSLFTHFYNLLELCITDCFHVTELLFNYTPNLIKLSISDCYNINAISNLDKLKELKLYTSYSFDKMKLTKLKLPNLIKITITNYVLNDKSNINCINLKEVYLYNVSIKSMQFFNNLKLNKLMTYNCTTGCNIVMN